ncbi:hypothetical protein O3M35_011764 [Rhynocoris fuscipes]|uniref:Uncharacterized protein n=1 Tax=Rhynocoris fuscipes TaxID=488301 RepID=A0AAW1CWX4_9HEMI
MTINPFDNPWRWKEFLTNMNQITGKRFSMRYLRDHTRLLMYILKKPDNDKDKEIKRNIANKLKQVLDFFNLSQNNNSVCENNVLKQNGQEFFEFIEPTRSNYLVNISNNQDIQTFIKNDNVQNKTNIYQQFLDPNINLEMKHKVDETELKRRKIELDEKKLQLDEKRLKLECRKFQYLLRKERRPRYRTDIIFENQNGSNLDEV